MKFFTSQLPMTKRVAFYEVITNGYVTQYDTGECGDGGHGSRFYFKKPGAELNEFGQPLGHAEVSRIGRYWYTSYFPAPNRQHDQHVKRYQAYAMAMALCGRPLAGSGWMAAA